MISTLSPSDQTFLRNLNRVSDRLDRAQRQISSGVKLSRASDDPDRISDLLQARANLASVTQIQNNLVRVKAETDAGEQALSGAVDLYERARTLAAQGATGTQTASTRQVISQEIQAVLTQLVGTASTQVDGRYIFSGDSDQQPPYTVDFSQATPVSAYLGSGSTRVAEHPNGTTFKVSHTAQDIFDSADPTTNVFARITAVIDALNANDDAAVSAAVEGLTKPGDYLNSQLAFYGTTQNSIAQANTFSDNLKIQLQNQISQIQDADLTQSILELNQAQVQQQAALTAKSQTPRTSLFDYLK